MSARFRQSRLCDHDVARAGLVDQVAGLAVVAAVLLVQRLRVGR